MQHYEINAIFKNLYMKNKESWEQTRLQSYIVAQGNSTKKLKPQDIIKFPWEDEIKGSSNTSVSNADVERLRNMANQYLNNKTNGK